MGQAVHQQTQRQAGKHTLQHLFLQSPPQQGGWLGKSDGQDHCSLGLHAQQQFVPRARLQVQHHGWSPAGQRPKIGCDEIAQCLLLHDAPVAGQKHINAVEWRVVDRQGPLSVGGGGQCQRHAQPHGFGADAQRTCCFGQRAEGCGVVEQFVGVVDVLRVGQHGQHGPHRDRLRAVVEHQQGRLRPHPGRQYHQSQEQRDHPGAGPSPFRRGLSRGLRRGGAVHGVEVEGVLG